jgi:signal transduction histidine kinase
MQARLATAGAPLARLGDWLIPLGLAVFGLYETLGKAPPERGAKLLQTLGVLAVAAPLLWRRRAPLAVLAVVVVGFAVAWPAERSTGGVTFAAVFGLLIAVFSVGASAERARAVPVVAVAAAMVVAMLVADVRAGYLRPADAAGSFVFFAVGFYAGELVRVRHLRAVALEEQAAALERERDERARAAVAEERARMARELHDILAHTLSTMVLQAGASRQVLRSDLETVEELLLSVERTGREALGEVRRLLGLLRASDDAGGLLSQPTLASIHSLIQETTKAGLPVDLRVEGEPVALSSGLGLSAYRIVQEALTNALKHAGPARAEVVIRYGDRDLELVISDDGAGGHAAPADGHPAGHGLLGVQERVTLYGGSMTAGPRAGGGYALRARLPLDPARS